MIVDTHASATGVTLTLRVDSAEIATLYLDARAAGLPARGLLPALRAAYEGGERAPRVNVTLTHEAARTTYRALKRNQGMWAVHIRAALKPHTDA